MKTPFFSIVIPLFNKQQYIERTLKSVLSQTYQNFEIIIVNDGSSDGGNLIAESYTSDTVTVINQKNCGVSSARNRGIKAAKYDFICLIDADDAWVPNFLQEIANLIHDFPNHHIFSLRHEIIDDDGSLIYPKVKLPADFRGVIKNFTRRFTKSNGLINASSVCLRKQFFLELGGFPEGQNQGEDIYLWLLYDLNTDIVFYNWVGSCYFRNTNNRSTDRLTPEGLPFHFVYFYKLMKHSNFVPKYGCQKKKELGHYLRKQALAQTAQLIVLQKRPLALAHTKLLYSMNKPTGMLCYLVTLIPTWSLGNLKIVRNLKRKAL